MLDIKFIRENPDVVKRACELKKIDDRTDEILALDARVRELKTITQTKTAEKNKITREIPTAADRAPLIARSKEIANEMFLGEGTIRNYLSVILEKLCLRDRTQLVIFYFNYLIISFHFSLLIFEKSTF